MNEDNNIENTENMKIVVVAQDGSGDYENVQEALFFEESTDILEILITEGTYRNIGQPIVINRIGETSIIGSNKVKFLGQEIKVCSNLIIKNLSFVMSFFEVTKEEVSLILQSCSLLSIDPIFRLEEKCFLSISNSILSAEETNKKFDKHNTIITLNRRCDVSLVKNSIIDFDCIAYGSRYNNFNIDFLENIVFGLKEISLSKWKEQEVSLDMNDYTGNISNNLAILEKDESRENPYLFGKDRSDGDEVNTNFLVKFLSFKNIDRRDYRIEDPRYKSFGASDETILFFMDDKEEQTKLHKPNLSKKEILIYIDTSQFKKEFDDFVAHLKKESEIKNVIPIYSIEDLQKQRDVSTLVLVSPVDKAENEREVFNILKEAKKQKKKVFIFLADIKKHTGDKMNIAKMPQVLDTHTKLKEEENVSFYENTEQLEKIIHQRLQNSFPNVKLEKLKLKNIGHFSDLEIDFEESNQNAYCFIGTNGTGKTSILRAIILGLIGTSSKALDKNELQNLVKIYGIENESIKCENAFIELHYLVDNKKQHNKIVCEIGKDGTLEWKDEGKFVLLDEPFLESLVIAFSQLRGERGNNGNSNKETSRQLRPHISDVLPLVHNEVDKRLSDFSRWIIDLYAKANEKEVQINRQKNFTKRETEIIERTTINLVFEIVSELLDQKIKFKEVRENKEVWICTELAENGIPITLVSQGFNTIIGWIGGLLQRMQEVYGLHALGRKKEFRTYPAFCVIDELDPHLHPKVQANLMNVLKKYFPNTLFVFSTHSPLIIPYLEKENVFMLTQNGKVSNAHIHTKGRSYQSILLDFMNVSERPKEYADKLDILYRLIDDENIEEAKEKLAEIVKDFGENDPEILRAQTMIDFIED